MKLNRVLQQWLWLLSIWVISVLSLGIVSIGFKLLMTAAGFKS